MLPFFRSLQRAQNPNFQPLKLSSQVLSKAQTIAEDAWDGIHGGSVLGLAFLSAWGFVKCEGLPFWVLGSGFQR